MRGSSGYLGSISDLMSGLMILFLFIAICYMLQASQEGEKAIRDKQYAEAKAVEATANAEDAENQREIVEDQARTLEEQKGRLVRSNEKIREIAAAYTELEAAIYAALQKEFANDLPRWNATLERDNTIRFNEPEVLFETGKSELRDQFRNILKDFFPRYLDTVYQTEFREEMSEIRIEGHTSSQWKDARTSYDRYLLNAALSQGRALAVLDFCFRLPDAQEHRDLMIRDLRANGLSYSRPIFSADGSEDNLRSQRVEIRVMSKTRERIIRILETQQEEKTEEPEPTGNGQ
jgi:outer membrane protein OmpA-like peptidoglycan-associated protein